MLNVAFLVIYIIASRFLSGADLYIMLTIHFGIYLVSLLRQKSIVITPIHMLYAGVIIVNIANINLIAQVNAHQLKTYAYIVPKYINQAALIWCISSTCVVIGYQLASKRTLPSIAFEISREKVLRGIFYLLLIGNLLVLLRLGNIFRGNQIGKTLGLLNSIGILFFARLWAKHDNKTYRFFAITLYILETYIALTLSFLRFELILPSFYLFSGYFIGKGHVAYIFSYRILPLILILYLFSIGFSAMQSNRANFIGVFTGDVMDESTLDKSNENSGALLDRSANVAQMTNCVNLVERNGLYAGRASAPIVVALVPRFLWPDKPLIMLGAWFALEIGVAYKNERGISNNSINMTVAGELYLDFGWVGVLVGSLLFGMFLSILWNSTHFYESEYNLVGTIFGGYLILLAIGSYADLQIIVTLTSTYLIFLIIKRIAKAL